VQLPLNSWRPRAFSADGFDLAFDVVFAFVFEVGVIPNEVPHFFFPAALRRARDAERDLLSAEQSGFWSDRSSAAWIATKSLGRNL
jgi:hypothetical protein